MFENFEIFLINIDKSIYFDIENLIGSNFKRRKLKRSDIIKISLFYNIEEFEKKDINAVEGFCNRENIFFSAATQTPENGFAALEIVSANLDLRKKNKAENSLSLEGRDFKAFLARGQSAEASRCYYIFEKLDESLQNAGMNFLQIVRQWSYIENIASVRLEDGAAKQNYQDFNDARSKIYEKYLPATGLDLSGGYPAATGIGCDSGVLIEFLALSGTSLHIKPLSNPKQKNAYQYAEKELAGDNPAKTTPKFERAKLIFNPDAKKGAILVSGTAAIEGESSSSAQSAPEQTLQTIDNIFALVSKENVDAALYELNAELDRIEWAHLRVYVKRFEDIPATKAICEKYFPGATALYLRADVCREELLVEIEAVCYATFL